MFMMKSHMLKEWKMQLLMQDNIFVKPTQTYSFYHNSYSLHPRITLETILNKKYLLLERYYERQEKIRLTIK